MKSPQPSAARRRGLVMKSRTIVANEMLFLLFWKMATMILVRTCLFELKFDLFICFYDLRLISSFLTAQDYVGLTPHVVLFVLYRIKEKK